MGSEGLTATRELVEWVDLIDAPGTTLADLVMRSKAELAAQPAAGEGLRLALSRIAAWSVHYKSESKTQLRGTMELIHREAIKAVPDADQPASEPQSENESEVPEHG